MAEPEKTPQKPTQAPKVKPGPETEPAELRRQSEVIAEQVDADNLDLDGEDEIELIELPTDDSPRKDETVPGGKFIQNGRYVDAEGRPWKKPKKGE